MKRDIELERKILLKIEENFRAGDIWMSGPRFEEYPAPIVGEHCYLLVQQGLIGDYKALSRLQDAFQFRVRNLTALGYDYLEMIKDEKGWKRLKKQADEKQIPKTIENLMILGSKMVAAFAKELFDVQ